MVLGSMGLVASVNLWKGMALGGQGQPWDYMVVLARLLA